MKIITVVLQVALLYAFYIAGNLLQNLLHLPIPGSIVGLLLLFAALLLKIWPIQWIETGSVFLLNYLPLLFVPATAGVMNYLGLFAGRTVWLFVVTIISTLLVMIFTGHTSQLLAKFRGKRKEKAECEKQLSESSSS
ncbi:CidA/LrgA family protein [Lentibacillus cibarius]|uniref:CidA/LrgA family protein n=1 Tax=Lentibacillus cibarius TaxID=2583219 RepID=A0A549YHA6_9BACI|nr:CidA/LrgA family protein [Lentibacillus cibarius]TRM11269.1 CidA/LrgA family protein [Lentibacillus cibarius]